MTPLRRANLAVLAALVAFACPSSAAAFDLWAVGDGADSGSNDDAVAAFLQSRVPDRVFYLGDVYGTAAAPDGSVESFNLYYDPGFGRLKSLTSPTPGNHEFPPGTGYDQYWGSLAPQNGGHRYAFDAGGWHLISLNSEEPIGEGSAQLTWLRNDLAAHPGTCTIAFEHKPRFTQGLFKGQYETTLAPMWASLSGHAVALLSGHDHNYQRFVPVDGLVQFVVGTGGHGFHTVTPSTSLAAYLDNAYGALHLVLTPGHADYEFVTVSGTRQDAGSLGCAPPSAPPTPGPPPEPAPGPVPGSPPPGGQPGTPGTTPAHGHDLDPLVLISSPRAGRSYRRGPRRLSGTAENVAAPVWITLTRQAHGQCRALGPRGFRYSCRARPRLRAQGLARWLLLRGAPLPSGRYRLFATAGSVADSISFRVL
jgi:hypothetical protein